MDTTQPRRGSWRRHGSNNLVDGGEDSPGRAMRQVLALTAQARATLDQRGTPNTSLLLGRRTKTLESASVFADGATAEGAIKAWSASAGLLSSHRPPTVRARRLRRGVQVLYSGPRTNTIDTHEDVYLLRDEQVREESTEVVAAGPAEAVEHAETRVRMRIVPQAAGATAHDAEQLANQAGIAPGTATQPVAGRSDTAVAACTDFDHSPFTPSGPCAVPFLLCFACPNAVATGRHLPRIVSLHRTLQALRCAVDAATWTTDWAEHHGRVADLLNTHTTEAERATLHAQLPEDDRDLIDRMLDRRLDS